MRILVTGGAGFVGSACLRHLLAHGYEALAYDNLAQGHPEAVPAGRLVVGDIADTQNLAQTLRDFKADAVMHFAAATYVGESVSNPEYHYRNNIGAPCLSSVPCGRPVSNGCFSPALAPLMA